MLDQLTGLEKQVKYGLDININKGVNIANNVNINNSTKNEFSAINAFAKSMNLTSDFKMIRHEIHDFVDRVLDGDYSKRDEIMNYMNTQTQRATYLKNDVSSVEQRMKQFGIESKDPMKDISFYFSSPIGFALFLRKYKDIFYKMALNNDIANVSNREPELSSLERQARDNIYHLIKNKYNNVLGMVSSYMDLLHNLNPEEQAGNFYRNYSTNQISIGDINIMQQSVIPEIRKELSESNGDLGTEIQNSMITVLDIKKAKCDMAMNQYLKNIKDTRDAFYLQKRTNKFIKGVSIFGVAGITLIPAYIFNMKKKNNENIEDGDKKQYFNYENNCLNKHYYEIAKDDIRGKSNNDEFQYYSNVTDLYNNVSSYKASSKLFDSEFNNQNDQHYYENIRKKYNMKDGSSNVENARIGEIKEFNKTLVKAYDKYHSYLSTHEKLGSKKYLKLKNELSGIEINSSYLSYNNKQKDNDTMLQNAYVILPTLVMGDSWKCVMSKEEHDTFMMRFKFINSCR